MIKPTQSAPIYKFGEFVIDSGIGTWGTHYFDKELARESMRKHGISSLEIKLDSYLAHEWGYTFFLNIKDGIGRMIGKGGFNPAPDNRKEAITQLRNWLYGAYNITDESIWEGGTGHYLWQHYSAEFGASCVGSEVGESISSTQTHLAFSRGAGRQYGIPWFTDFSFWHWGYINDYSGAQIWQNCSTPIGGHSPSLYKRTFIASYMGGTSHFYSEAIPDIAFINEKDDDGFYKLSPIGETFVQLNLFTKNNNDMGISYVPFGIVIDRYHGMFSGDTHVTMKKVFQFFDYTAGDEMTYRLFDMFFPGSWNVYFDTDESHYMVNGPYGDTCDVLLQNTSLKVLKTYPCLILSGNIALSGEEVSNYMNYVTDGGTLILNTAYLEYFPEYNALYSGSSRQDIAFSKGKVIIYGGDYELAGLDEIIREQLKIFVPFKFSRDIEYLINVKDNSLIVTLIDNKDYYFNRATGEKTDSSVNGTLTLSYTGEKRIKTVRELWSGEDVYINGNSFKTTFAPGDIKVYEFVLY